MNPALLLGGAALLGLAGSRYIKASGRQHQLKPSNSGAHEVAGLSEGQSMILALLAIATGVALGGLLPQSRIEDTALGKVKASTDFKRQFGEGSDAAPAGIGNPKTEYQKPIANQSASRNMPFAEGVGVYPADPPGPETENVFYRGTVKADS